jgi:hypothetical protein
MIPPLTSIITSQFTSLSHLKPSSHFQSIKMQMTSFTTILALAMSVAAVAPVAEKTNMALSSSAALGGAKSQCSSGDLACCDSKETLSGDGILGNLLAKGALNGLLGNDDAACAKTSALDDLNVLGMFQK